jgi:hypothetical protein
MESLKCQLVDRYHSLNRFLSKMVTDEEDPEIAHTERSDDSASEEDQENDASGDDDDASEEINLQLLKSTEVFLTGEEAFNHFKASLHLFVHPPTTLQEALAIGNSKTVQKLLTKSFDEMATGEYVWIYELDAAGYSREQIAQLLWESKNDTPWIYFEMRDLPFVEVSLTQHLQESPCKKLPCNFISLKLN